MKESSRKQRYRLETPEGGWGYLVCLGMALTFTTAGSGLTCFGLIFNDFLESIGEGTKAVAIITSCSFGAMSFVGLFSNTIIARFGMRNVGVAGGTFLFLGCVIQIFAQSVYYLILASTIHGCSFGLVIPIIFSTFNNYFVERRVLMLSATQCLIGLGHMVFPIFIQFLLVQYGFRGCLAILAALNAHAIFGMLCMHPVEWHMKKVPITDEEMLSNNADSDNDKTDVPLMSELNGMKPSKSIHSLKHLKMSESPAVSRRASIIGRRGSSIGRRASSIASLGNWTSAVVVSEANEPDPKEIGKWKLMVDFLDLKLLKKPVYVNIVLGISLSFYADMAFFTIQPLYLYELNYSQADIASIIAFGAAADLLSRCLLALSSFCCKIPSRYVYFAGAVFSIIVRYAILFAYDFWSMAILTGAVGFLKTWLHVPLPLIFADYLPKERFASGYGLFMFLQGNIMFFIAPVLGFIRDSTKSYIMAFHFLNFLIVACVIPWSIEFIWVQCRKTWSAGSTEVSAKKQPGV